MSTIEIAPQEVDEIRARVRDKYGELAKSAGLAAGIERRVLPAGKCEGRCGKPGRRLLSAHERRSHYQQPVWPAGSQRSADSRDAGFVGMRQSHRVGLAGRR